MMGVPEFRRQHGRFCFLEVLFSLLVWEHGLSHFNWKKDALIAGGTTEFWYRPELVEYEEGICHSVKNELVHEEICRGKVGGI